MKPDVFEQSGGFARVRRIVSDFYERVLESPALARHFHGIALDRLIDHQTKFIASVMGGPASFSPEHLRRAHAPLRISADEFEEAAVLLRDALEDGGLPDSAVELVCARVAALSPYVVAGPDRDADDTDRLAAGSVA